MTNDHENRDLWTPTQWANSAASLPRSAENRADALSMVQTARMLAAAGVANMAEFRRMSQGLPEGSYDRRASDDAVLDALEAATLAELEAQLDDTDSDS